MEDFDEDDDMIDYMKRYLNIHEKNNAFYITWKREEDDVLSNKLSQLLEKPPKNRERITRSQQFRRKKRIIEHCVAIAWIKKNKCLDLFARTKCIVHQLIHIQDPTYLSSKQRRFN